MALATFGSQAKPLAVLDPQCIGDDITLANEDELSQLFLDCARGAVPPIGKCYGLDVLLDESINERPEVYMKAGDHETLIHMGHTQFAQLTEDAQHGRFSVHD